MLNPLFIAAEGDVTPNISLDAGRNIFEIEGWSHPEDAIAFYTPVADWLSRYEGSPNPQTDFYFKFQYYNTASAKQIVRIISALESISRKSKVAIHWHYDAEDSDMLAAGERFAKMCDIPFKFVTY